MFIKLLIHRLFNKFGYEILKSNTFRLPRKPNVIAQMRQSDLALTKLIEDNVYNFDSVLDIGSGSGIFLSYLQKRGWNVKGIEPDPLMQSYSINNLDLDVDKTIFSEWVSKKKNNLIYLSHVLDDRPCLKETIDKIYKNLEKGGYLFIEVPNHSWPFRLNFEKVEDLEIGNYFFSIESLRYLIEKNNLTILNMQTFHLVHLNTFYQKLISPFMFLMKLKPEKYRPYLRLIAKK